jgi:hypothetical protein
MPPRPKTHKSADTVVAELKRLFDITNDPKLPDVACAILVTSYLNDALGALLDSQFVGNSTKNTLLAPENGSLSSLRAKADIAYCMNLITQGCASRVITVGEIRNKFAHKFPALTFRDPKITEMVEGLKPPRQVHYLPETPEVLAEPRGGNEYPRRRFVAISLELCITILMKAAGERPRIQPCDDIWEPFPLPSTDQPSESPPQ